MVEYTFFRGCMIPALQPFVEASVLKVLEKFGIRLSTLKDETCCPVPEAPKALDELTWYTMAARNITLAETLGLDLLTVCSGCYETLAETNHALKENRLLKGIVNERLAQVGCEFKGSIQVKNIIDVLYNAVGLKTIQEAITKPLEGVKVCLQIGCRLYRTEETEALPHKFREIVKATECTIIDYETDRVCCGFPTIYTDPNFGYMQRTKLKLDDMMQQSPDCIVTICPACLNQFEVAQLDLRAKGYNYNLPCVNLLELLALSLGIPSSSLGIQWHRIKPDQLIKKIEGER
ncbi:MAG: CoB--CoM heterodisulfide reductase iron-sulfur subunit B family protein [Nitrososphaerales archaeon]